MAYYPKCGFSPFTPARIDIDLDTSFTFQIEEASATSSKAIQIANELSQEGWRIYVVDQKCGRCYYQAGVITIPSWAFARDKRPSYKGYLNWYLSHELAHAYAGPAAGHGPEFMKNMKAICDPANWKYELNYKPAFAAAAGILDIPEDF